MEGLILAAFSLQPILFANVEKTLLFLVDSIQAGKCPATSQPKTNNSWSWSLYKLLSMGIMSLPSFFFLRDLDT